ncbi:uncharacterized protein EI97DRAFT_77565 [Westerdykella ornata]|uniref:Uncharacterized protein n=1 Tax=Westerdykella ornata TaxID=318751 RepID=A0A6A6JHU4_WESOR|nr:uncharacterized protein EI97DRAFT_77565 [Westerdykella ornata]KAF2275528.1 hypothetical protein EI97DRAFT_77565 [Westerdykella ornata]
MSPATTPIKPSRVDSRYRHLPQDLRIRANPSDGEEIAREQKDEQSVKAREGHPQLTREQSAESIMGRPHHFFHRRQAPPTNTVTVAVEVVATVNANGAVITQETRTLPPAVALPSVPAVPPFPSDLHPPPVPAFPFPSGVLSVHPISQATYPAPVPTPETTAAVRKFASTFALNSTTSSTSFSRTSTSSRTTSLTSTSSSLTASSTSSSSSQPTTSIPATSTSAPAAWIPGPAGTAPPTVESDSSAGNSNTGKAPLETPKVVGSVIGSLAGTAILLLLLLFLFKRHKRKGTLQLSGVDTADNVPIATSGQEMATRSSIVPATAVSFLKRFSVASRLTAETSTTGERGFQRISGRKLPSAFSEGMTSEQFARGEGTLSGSSFYRDDKGFYGGPGLASSKEFGKEVGGPATYGTIGTKERFMPSPARTPVIHHPDDAPPWGASRNGGSTFSPPHTPNPDGPPRPTLGRSHPSHDGSRSSRFTENV